MITSGRRSEGPEMGACWGSGVGSAVTRVRMGELQDALGWRSGFPRLVRGV